MVLVKYNFIRSDNIKKIFGEINLTWKKLIIFAIFIGIYTGLMTLIPITYDTSFRDIAIQFEWWILFGILIIVNSKSSKDSALKCFIFFLISQPLVYLVQVPFNSMGFKLFIYYKYWAIWTILTLPMGYIGYYIKNNNIISLIILLPMLLLLSFLGIGYLNSTIENFPHHILSLIFCFSFIIIIVLNIFNKTKLKLLAFIITILFIIGYILLRGGLINSEYDVVRSLDKYKLKGEVNVTLFTATKQGNVSLIKLDKSYNIKLNGRKGGKYTFELTDEEKNIYVFEYYYDKEQNTVILNEKEQ